MQPGGDVRMSSSLYVRIDADRNAGRSLGEGTEARRLFEEDLEFRGGFDVELKDAWRVLWRCPGAKGCANFFAGFVPAVENDAVSADADVAKVVEFATRDDIEAAASLRQQFQDGQIAVGLHRETEKVRK